MKRLMVLALVVLAGCTTVAPPSPPPAPVPAPVGSGKPPCNGIWVPGEGCKKLAAGDSGATVRGVKEPMDLEEDKPQ